MKDRVRLGGLLEGQVHVLQPDFLIYSGWCGWDSQSQRRMREREKSERAGDEDVWESERKIATLRYFERSRTLTQTQTRTRRGGSKLSVHMTALCVKGMGLGLLI